MSQATQVQAISAPVQQFLSDSISMALEGLEVSQAQGKKFLESAFELGAAQAKDTLKYADEARARFADATNTANELLKERASLFNELPKDPVGATQKVISGYVEGYRKGLEVGAEALKSYVSLINDVWSRLEKASQETRENYVAYVGKLQTIVESTAKKN
jgi:flagellar biosynthesis/type III secretory pathway protein FliH